MSLGRVLLPDLVSRYLDSLSKMVRAVCVLAQLLCNLREMASDNFRFFSFLSRYTTASPGEEEGWVQYKPQTHGIEAVIDQIAGEQW